MTERRVHLRKHSSVWKWQLRKEKVLLWMAMQGHVLEIQHVGSTAMPGMIAKPLTDILAAVSDFECAMVQPR